MPAEPTEPQVVASPAAGIAAALAARGRAGPVLVIADDATIAACGPAWAGSFAAAGIVHRVVTHGVDVAAAAAGLSPRTVLGAGGAEALAAAAVVAAALDVSLVENPGSAA